MSAPFQTLHVLRNHDPSEVVSAFLRTNPGDLAVSTSVTLQAMSHPALKGLVDRIIATLTDATFRKEFYDAIKHHMDSHPWQTAFLIIGVVLMVNPLATAGFGALGPVAGSLAAAWQSSMGGTVAAGSAFSLLQSMGMLGSVAIPVAGAVVATGAVVAAAAGNEVEKWGKGEYGEPVKNWWNGDYGEPVKDWWNGSSTPVLDWLGHVASRK